MKTKIIVFVNQLLNPTNYARFEMGSKKKSTDLKFWCLTPILNKKTYLEYNSKDYAQKKDKNFIYLYSYGDILRNIKKLKKKTIFINFAGKSFFILLLEYFFILKGCIKIEVFSSFFHLTEKKKYQNSYKDLKSLLNFGFMFLVVKTLKKLNYKIFFSFIKLFEIKSNIYFVQNEYQYNKYLDQKKKIFKYNSNYITHFEKYKKKKSKNNFIVYIDQEFENSFESKITKNQLNLIDKEKYFKSLNSIFKDIENKNKKKQIIIAAHFRRSKKNLFDSDRKFYFDKTIDLIYNAKLVIGHNSTALNYAILFNKPILLLNFKILDSISVINSKVTDSFADELSIPKIDIDLDYYYDFKKLNNLDLLKVNYNKYNNYKNNYLTFKKNINKSYSLWSSISNDVNNINF